MNLQPNQMTEWRALDRARAMMLSLLLALGALTTGCTTYGTFSDSLFLVTPEEEIEIGQKVEPQIEAEMKMVDDPQVVNYIRTLGERVRGVVPSIQVPVNYYVVADDSINASALIGGNIYVHTGLIKAADDEAELVAVMAHELGHLAHRHSARQLSRATSAELLQGVLLGSVDGGQGLAIVTGLAKSGALTSYSREFEREADSTAVPALHNLGLDPLALKTFFQKLAAKHGDGGGALQFLSSHPTNSERMERVQGMAGTLPPREYARPTTELRRIQARLQQLGL